MGIVAAALLFVAYSIYSDVDAAGARATTILPYILLLVALLIALEYIGAVMKEGIRKFVARYRPDLITAGDASPNHRGIAEVSEKLRMVNAHSASSAAADAERPPSRGRRSAAGRKLQPTKLRSLTRSTRIPRSAVPA
jgi:hypothetical protein